MKKKKKIKKIWFVTREYDGLAGAGGVKDVCRQLAEALAVHASVTVVMPCYGFMNPKELGFRPAGRLSVAMNYAAEERHEEVEFWRRKERLASDGGKLTIFLADAQRFQEKQGVYTYTAEDELLNPLHISGQGHDDYFAMNVLLQKAALCLMMEKNKRPQIIHCHDGHTALIPALVRERDGFRHFFHATGLVVTIHNAGIGYHQEVGDLDFAQAITGLPRSFIGKNLLGGDFDPFIAAAPHAEINTVSENYAHELRATEADELTGWLGHFLMTRGCKLRGITNGIDPLCFDTREPEDLQLAASFSVAEGEMAGKAVCREALSELLEGELAQVERTGTLAPRPEQPLLTFIGRFSAQKGVDKLVKALHVLLAADPDFQVVILGSGQADIALGLRSLAADGAHGGRICLLEGFDQVLAGQIYAAGDFFIIPSQYEPCGLTDFIAQLHGNLPIVHHVGGLVKVEEGETGFAYAEHSSLALIEAVEDALATFRERPEKIMAMRRAAVERIAEKYTWAKVSEHYLELYGEALCND